MTALRAKLRGAWRKYRLLQWGTSPAGLSYHRALDDVWTALDVTNPAHDDVRRWIVKRRRELRP